MDIFASLIGMALVQFAFPLQTACEKVCAAAATATATATLVEPELRIAYGRVIRVEWGFFVHIPRRLCIRPMFLDAKFQVCIHVNGF